MTLLLLIAAKAQAAGTVTIYQQSPIGIYGDYTIKYPGGSQIIVNNQESKMLPAAENGMYLLHITAPNGAKMSTTVEKNGVEALTTVSPDVSFTVMDSDEITVTVTYRYDGTVIVESDPADASFELLGPNDLRVTGHTPARYESMAPGEYRATFHRRADCITLSPIQRSLDANATLSIIGKFTCGLAASSSSSSSSIPSVEPVEDINGGRTVRVWVAAHQAEALAGGTVRTTITVKNTGARTIHNVVVSTQIDPETAQFVTPLPRFGSVNDAVASWEIPQIYSGKTWTVTVPLALSTSLKQGTTSTVTARVSASDLAENNAGTALVATTTIGVTGLPVTGMRFDMLFLMVSLVATAVIAKKTVQRAVAERA